MRRTLVLLALVAMAAVGTAPAATAGTVCVDLGTSLCGPDPSTCRPYCLSVGG